MKKYKVVALVGTLALLANLLVPGMAFGAAQTGTLNVGCPAGGSVNVTLGNSPDDMTFTPVTLTFPPGAAKSSLENDLLAGKALGYLNKATRLEVSGNTIENCESTETDWKVDVVATDLTAGGTRDIAATKIYLMTSNNVANVAGNAKETCDSSANFCYKNNATGPLTVYGNGAAACSHNTAADWDTPATYTCAMDNASATDIMVFNQDEGTENDGLNSNAILGATLYCKNCVDGDQPAGVYTGTLTYTLTVAAL